MAEVTPTPIRDRFLNKVCFITGGGGAIGLCTAIRFVNEGARVVLVDVSPETLAAAEERIAAALPSSVQLQDRLLSLQADVTSEADVAKTFEETLRKWGRLDCAFLNVGVSYAGKSLFDTSEEEYDRVMRINVKSGLRGTPGLSVYSTSKFAIRGLGQSAAAELGQYGIRVNTIHPSGVDTPMFRQTWTKEKIEEIKKAVPMGRVAEVEDIAGAVTWLASDDAGFVNGAMIKVDGGVVSF
ncbi:Short-chain dehydrogenase/reductase SDR [Lasiodiplodia theobromae]|uniref:Short-chain dehydrogenase/reductase SDR n=1 Tax=Lasiodiplodia theobromae TaxID=45133 RepID=UPI0015C401DB|nr:Short-chain dehydrogenase/reductase SDR [Lasiodiplodia theobromae]KAF4544944.1 Short-chain dehydrogenase/reductase SDR [Lasiodiplodia theobromae]